MANIDYEHHVFISYARGDLWTRWVREKFLDRLHAYLQTEFGRTNIFVDEQIQSGANWDLVLRRKIARSKVMIALISADYFRREWCRREMALMLEREEKLNLIGHDENYGLLIPVRLGDGHSFPDIVGRIQYHDFESFADPDLPPNTPIASEFNRSVKRLASAIALTFPRAPEQCCDSWKSFTGDSYMPQLDPKPPGPQLPPRLII